MTMPLPRPADSRWRYRDVSDVAATAFAALSRNPVGALFRVVLAVVAVAIFFVAPSLILLAVQALR
jgi:hypothetical protein